jgi:preprotein translocase subunit SecD
VIYNVLAISFGAIALLALAGAWIKRAKRGWFVWATLCAAFAAGAAFLQVFWPVPVFGLMALWALFVTTDVMSQAWRNKVGFTAAIAAAAALSIYPTVHDEVTCGDANGARKNLPANCPGEIAKLPAEKRELQQKASLAGNRGMANFLLSNLSYRMVRGLDLKGGLRLVYTVDVQEAIKDKRDRYYDNLRSALAKSYKLNKKEAPTVEEMAKLTQFLSMRKPSQKVDSIVIEFKNEADAQKHINDKFLIPFVRELLILRAGTTISFSIMNRVEADIREKAVGQARETIIRRIDGMGVKEASISVRDEDIIVEIPGSKESDFASIRDIIAETARLEFKLLDDAANFFQKYARSAADSLPKGLRFDIENAPLGKTAGGGSRTQPNHFARLNKLSGESMDQALKRFREWVATLEVDEDHEVGFQKLYEPNPDTQQLEAVGWRTFYLRAKAELTGDMVRDALAGADSSDTGMGGWYVNMTLGPVGAQIFEKITGENVKKRFAIILDGKVESAPVIQEAIGGGTARISMGAGGIQQQLEDARKLELVLRSGALPAPISPSNEQRIGPSLGSDSIDDGIKAGALGGMMVLVLIFMFYRRAGFIANLAVAFNLVLQIAVLSMFSASMTLPGIAGLALTVGVAVDANVLINERIKEELRLGKSARAAVAIGYDKAFTAIIDGNATTLIAGLILAQYGTGPIKGFAVTLIIGMLTNIFTGVVVSRLFFEFWVRGRRNVKLSIGA